MVVSLRRSFDPDETDRLLEHRQSRPLAACRRALATATAAAVHRLGVSRDPADHRSGAVPGHGFDMVLALKVALVALFALIQVSLTRRPARALILVNFGLALLIVVLSGLLVRVWRSRNVPSCSIGSASACICWPRACGSATCSSGRWSSARRMKRIEPPADRRAAARAQPVLGALGWPALAILVVRPASTCSSVRGIGPGRSRAGAAFSAGDDSLAVKLGAWCCS